MWKGGREEYARKEGGRRDEYVGRMLNVEIREEGGYKGIIEVGVVHGKN